MKKGISLQIEKYFCKISTTFKTQSSVCLHVKSYRPIDVPFVSEI